MTRIPATERRAALVQAALRVVAERGVQAATTRAIVAEAGMSLASFHYAFGSRDELMSELVASVVAGEERALSPVLRQPEAAESVVEPSLRDAIRAGLQRYFEHLAHSPDHEKAMFELTHYALRSDKMAPLARRQYESYYSLGRAALEAAAEQTGARWRRSPEELAPLLVALTDGLTIAWLVNRDDAAAAAIMDAAADALATLALEPERTGKS